MNIPLAMALFGAALMGFWCLFISRQTQPTSPMRKIDWLFVAPGLIIWVSAFIFKAYGT